MTSGTCPKCKSTHILQGLEVQAFQPGKYDQPVQLVAYTKPDALVFKGRESSDLTAHVCASCGFTEFYAKTPQALVVRQS